MTLASPSRAAAVASRLLLLLFRSLELLAHVPLPRLVDLHVHLQVGLAVERPAARGAEEVPGALVQRPAAEPQVVADGEALAALVTEVGFLPRVDPHVDDAARVLGERLVAVVAAVGLLARVDPRVLDHVVPLLELLLAVRALEGLVSLVALGHVSYEKRVLPEMFAAETAGLVPPGRLLQAHEDVDAFFGGSGRGRRGTLADGVRFRIRLPLSFLLGGGIGLRARADELLQLLLLDRRVLRDLGFLRNENRFQLYAMLLR